MGDFVNYTPGEYAKEHIRITPTTLADGRDFFYLDDDPEYVSGVKTRELKDPRQLPYRFSNQLNAAGEEVPYAAPEMRRDPLTGDWIPMATARMNRPITAGPGATAKGNPLAARKPGDHGIVETTYGYHIMYYVGEGEPSWVCDADEALRSNAYTAMLEENAGSIQMNADVIYSINA